jgi:DNA ligase-associated metallophosphoesterase
MSTLQFSIGNERITLLPERAIYISKKKILILSDLHLGKINHFRKAGIAVPTSANKANTELLVKLLMELKPKRVIFVGDLFHSNYNTEWEVLGQVIQHFENCSFELVPGNHDIMSDIQYQRHSIQVHETQYSLSKKLILTHEPIENPKVNHYYISGHIHPAITLMGRGRQSVTFPCFWFGKQQGFLPAFGVFTGFKRVKPESGDKIFGIVNENVVEINSSST